MNWRCVILILLGALVLAPPTEAQDSANLRGDSAQTRKRLVEAEQKLIAGKPADAADDLQRVLDESADDLISLDGKQYRAARWIAHGILTRLPDAALKIYQDRIDEPASKLLAAAKRTNDLAPLRELVDRYFVSRPAEEGLLLLGDLLFERGEFRTAEQTWRRLLPDGGADIAYPGSRSDPAALRARIVLAVIYQGDLDRAARELVAFRKRYPGASGQFAGKTGPFAETLQGWLDNPPAIAPRANAGANWPAYGGGSDRSGLVSTRLSGEWPAQPTWKEQLTTVERSEAAPAGSPRRPPLGHPVVVNGHVFVSDGWNLQGFHLLTGRATAVLRLAKPPPIKEQRDPYPKADPDPCPTLSVDGDRIYVRVGLGVIKSTDDKKEPPAAIACVRVGRKEDGTCTLKEEWRVKPPRTEEGTTIVWEGAPAVSDRRMWAAFARFEGGRLVHGIACYDPSDSAMAPERTAWTADVCDGPVVGSEGRARHELITLAGRNVIFCSNTGAVVALDAATGRRAWGFRYSRSRHTDSAQSPYPSPVVSSGGRLFVAPADGDCVYALDPESGRVLWQTGTTIGSRIVGVCRGRLIVTVDGPVKGIWGLSAETGLFQSPGGWIQPGILGYGQGFVTEDIIVWPTRSGLIYLRSADGVPLGDSRLSPEFDGNSNCFGNVVFADGVLVVVAHSRVWGYVSQAREFGPPSPRSDRDPARIQFERVIDQSERALARGEPETARQLLVAAVRGQLPRQYRAWLAARLLLLTPQTDDESKLRSDVRDSIDLELCGEWLFDTDGIPVTLGALLDRHIGRGSSSVLAQSVQKHCPWERPIAPLLDPGSDIVRTLKLPAGSAPLRRIPGSSVRPRHLFATTDVEMIAVSMTGGEITRFASQERFTFAADLGDGFVAAGPTSVAIYGSDREPLWVFRVPTTEPLPARQGMPYLHFGTDPSFPELSAFRLNGTWLFALLGERHLIAFDLEGKRIAWVIGPDGSSGFQSNALPNALRIGPTFGVMARNLLVQVSDGRRWLIELETGRIAPTKESGNRTSKVWWRQSPGELEANTVPIPDGAGLVRMVDLALGNERWRHQIEGESSLSGDPPQIAAWGDTMLLAVQRNHGVELDRLDPLDGRSLWTGGPAFLDAGRTNLSHADADAERIIVPVGDSLVAVSLESGMTLWKAELPASRGSTGWVVRVGRNCIIAYPESAIPREPVVDVLGRLGRSLENEPTLGRLPGLLMGAYDAWVTRNVPIVLLDLETGKRLVRFDIPASGPVVTAHFEGDRAVVATGDRVAWLR